MQSATKLYDETRPPKLGQVWITTQEYIEWEVGLSKLWKAVDKDFLRELILIERVTNGS